VGVGANTNPRKCLSVNFCCPHAAQELVFAPLWLLLAIYLAMGFHFGKLGD